MMFFNLKNTMNIHKIAEKRIENNSLTLESQQNRLKYLTNKNSLEAKVINKIIELLAQN